MIPHPARPRAVTRAVLMAVALLLGAGACTSGGTTPLEGEGTLVPPAPHGPPPATLAGFYAQRLTWTPCGKYFQCARLYVPFDYARPDGRAFSLPVIKLPAARPALRIGPLVLNPGGPGESGLQYTLAARAGEFTQAVRDRFDIVGFDPRGVGGSIPSLHCRTGHQADAPVMPDTPARLAAYESAVKAYVQACARIAGAMLPYLGTQWAARDMDILRAALGQSRLTYFGWSYGTVLGASYVQQFPRRVRAFALDGAVDPQASGLDADMAQAQGFTITFGQFAAWCTRQPGCPLHGTLPQVTQQVAGLIARANARPLTNRRPGAQVANGEMMLLGIVASLYFTSWWPDLRDGLSQALASGDGTVLVQLADAMLLGSPDGRDSNLVDVENAVDCIDRPWPKSVAAYQAAAAAAAKAAPLFGLSFVYGSLACAYWPVPSHHVLSGPASGTTAPASGGVPPVLVLGELRDPATPYAGAVALARWLRSGVLLGWDGAGHTSYLEGSSCVDNAVDAYLISLRVPRAGTVCR
jgi:pimeloyl-ACP methyl ester carboxylesterase